MARTAPLCPSCTAAHSPGGGGEDRPEAQSPACQRSHRKHSKKSHDPISNLTGSTAGVVIPSALSPEAQQEEPGPRQRSHRKHSRKSHDPVSNLTGSTAGVRTPVSTLTGSTAGGVVIPSVLSRNAQQEELSPVLKRPLN